MRARKSSCICLVRLLITSLTALGLSFGQSSRTISLPNGVTQGASVEGITEYDLSNGLRVLLFPDMTKSTATVNITYLVGSRNENYGETGMAHLLEHMMFKGSSGHKNVMQELTEHGARTTEQLPMTERITSRRLKPPTRI